MTNEPTAHLTDQQRLNILREGCLAAREGRSPKLTPAIDLAAVLRSFRGDQVLDAELSFALGFEHIATRSELSATAAGRLRIQLFDPPPSSLEAIEAELAANRVRT